MERVELDPVAELRELVRGTRSGEFVCVSGDDEVHVFLQHGRLAWAADNRHPYAFSRFLKERGGVGEARLTEVIEECSRLHSPVGEKLIEHGLATADLVHRGLRHQVELAVETLVALPKPRWVFLVRKFREYRLELTFELDSFFPAPARWVNEAPDRLLSRLVHEVPELCWAQIVRGREVLERAFPDNTEEKVPAALVEAMEGQQVDVTVIRSDTGALVGAGIPGGDGATLWCEVGGGAALGGAVARLWTLLSLSSLTPPTQGDPSPPVTVGEPSLAVDVALESLLKEPELLGVFAGESASGLCGATRHEAVATLARQRFELLGLAPGSRPRLGTLAGGLWCVGAPLKDTPEALWIVAEGRMPQGLLWAQLPAIERSLAQRALRTASAPS